MKLSPLLIIIFTIVIGCQSNTKNTENTEHSEPIAYLSLGDSITESGAMSKEKMAELYENLTLNDTLEAKFSSTVNAVCQRKGCWMRLDLGAGQEVQVKFKDYGFFVPMNLDREEVIVEGKAYISVLTEHEKKYYASDEGKSEEEIAAISGDTKTLIFEAHGVLIKE